MNRTHNKSLLVKAELRYILPELYLSWQSASLPSVLYFFQGIRVE